MTPFVRRFRVPLYRIKVTVVFGDTLEANHLLIPKCLRDQTFEKDDVAVTYNVTNGRTAISCLGSGKSRKRLRDTILHEAWHLVICIGHYLGLEHGENSEAHSYVNGFVSDKLLAAYEEFVRHETTTKQKETV